MYAAFSAKCSPKSIISNRIENWNFTRGGQLPLACSAM